MTILLPDPGEDDSVERHLAAQDGMLALLRPAEERTVQLTVPSFDLDTAVDLVGAQTTTRCRCSSAGSAIRPRSSCRSESEQVGLADRGVHAGDDVDDL